MIYCGDCLDVMRGMEPNSVDAIVTDPPYGLEFMGKEWDRLDTAHAKRDRADELSVESKRPFLAHSVSYQRGKSAQDWHYAWAVEALRIAKPGCHLLAFGGTRTFHRLACAIEDAGWEMRDTLMWVYGSGFPKSHNLKDEWEGWGTALKPAWEPIIMARKPLDGTVAANVQKWGTGAINVDGCRVGIRATDESGWSKTGSKASENRAMSGANYDRTPKSEVGKGRWPANLITDGSEEVLELFPETATWQGKRTKPGTGYVFNGHGDKPIGHIGRLADSGSAARFFYCAKASRAEREAGCEGMEERPSQCAVGMKQVTAKNWGDGNEVVYERTTKARNFHPTVKPLALMRYLCRLVTPPNGLILDPFMGSGTTGMAAKIEGFRFIGIEQEQEYVDIAERRIAHVGYQMEIEGRPT
jgi:site-specific DNA-methyltransferase (adenine-specific)